MWIDGLSTTSKYIERDIIYCTHIVMKEKVHGSYWMDFISSHPSLLLINDRGWINCHKFRSSFLEEN